MSQEERVALVTGASRGIGRAVAERLAEEGIRVAVNYRSDEQQADSLVMAIRSRGGQALKCQADVSQQAAAESLVEEVVSAWGRLDILVNNAGITRDTLVPRMKGSDWDDVLRTNLSSVFHCTKAALKTMVRHRYGRIINMASVAGLVGNPGQANYSAAKAGVIGFTKAVAKEWASRGITCNAVAPGLIETDLTKDMPEASRNALLGMIPVGRAGSPQEIAEAVWYLAQAGYVTGQVMVVDGGLAMH